MIAINFVEQGFPKKMVAEMLEVNRSIFYYKPISNNKKGRKKSNQTYTLDGGVVDNKEVVEQIKKLLEKEFVDYGYLKVTHWLRQKKRYLINPKKVYRLMRENGLLNKIVRKKKKPRNWVKELLPPTEKPFDYLEFDIKYFYVAGQNRNALLLTIICVKTRWVLGHYMAWEIKKGDVTALFDQLFEAYPLPDHFYVRNDNGAQFVAIFVQAYFEARNVTQEFCKPATPEQNAHIESYHSIQERVICQQYEFETLVELRNTLNRFVLFYDFERIHSGIGYIAPIKELEKNDIFIDHSEVNLALDCSSLDLFCLV